MATGGSQHMRIEGSEHFHQGFDKFTKHVASDDCEDSDHEDDEDTTTHPSQRDSNVARPPHDRFHKPFIIRTSFSWEPTEEFANRPGFENVLRDRYSDIMLEMRNESAYNARASGHFIINGEDNFNIMCDFLPKLLSQDTWRQFCLIWNTEEWAKKSERGRNNRMKVDSSGAISRHTGGSVGYVEHRIRLESYSFYMVEKYSEDETQHPIGDIDLWERSQGEKKSFGIGSSNRHFILTRTPSSSIESTPSNVMFEQSQQEAL
ncbi:hypothetical protein R6Q57_005580 [Mikania cordata]